MQKIKDILSKEMTRKEFIKTLGFGIATVAGLSTVLRMLGKENPWQTDTTQPAVYGGSSYGGDHKR